MLLRPDSSPSNPADCTGKWWAIYTRHQHEKIVAQILLNKGFHVFLPLYSTTHRWGDRDKKLLLPLFPCYVFLVGSLERTLDIVKAPGVHALVSTAGRPSVIPPEEIQTIRQLVGHGRSVEPHPFLRLGDRVRLKSGPLFGIEGILVRKKNRFRLVVSVEMLGRSAATEVDVSRVERLSRKSEHPLFPSPTELHTQARAAVPFF